MTPRFMPGVATADRWKPKPNNSCNVCTSSLFNCSVTRTLGVSARAQAMARPEVRSTGISAEGGHSRLSGWDDAPLCRLGSLSEGADVASPEPLRQGSPCWAKTPVVRTPGQRWARPGSTPSMSDLGLGHIGRHPSRAKRPAALPRLQKFLPPESTAKNSNAATCHTGSRQLCRRRHLRVEQNNP